MPKELEEALYYFYFYGGDCSTHKPRQLVATIRARTLAEAETRLRRLGHDPDKLGMAIKFLQKKLVRLARCDV